MRKTLSMLLLAAALPAAAIAAEHGERGPACDMGPGYYHKGADGMAGMPGKMGGMHGFNLNPEQRKTMHKAYQEAMQKELQASRDKADKAFRDQLTPEQLKAFDERKAEQEKRRAEWEEFRKWKAEKEGKPQ